MFLSQKVSSGVLLIILAITAICYWPITEANFVNYDDHYLVVDNVLITSPLKISTLLSSFAGWYHPITNFSYWMDAKLFGLNSHAFHSTNLFLHLLVVISFYCWCLRFSQSQTSSLILTAFLALHPAHVESVAWIAERKGLLAALFFWLALLAHERSRWILCWLLMICSLFCKPLAVIFPFILLWIELFKNQNQDWRAHFHERKKILFFFFIPCVSWMLINWLAQVNLRPPSETHFWKILTLFPLQIGFYLSKSLIPISLKPAYDLSDLTHVLTLSGGLLYLVLAGVAAKHSSQFRKDLVFGFGFFLIVMLPMFKWIPFGDESPVADRYLYVAQFGLVWPWLKIPTKSQTEIWARSLGILGLLLIFIPLTYWQVGHWKSSETLWNHVLRMRPESQIANDNLGALQLDSGNYLAALDFLKKGSSHYTNWINQSFALIEMGRMEEADFVLKKAEEISPGDPQTLSQRGLWHFRQGHFDSAESIFHQALTLRAPLLTEKIHASVMANLAALAFEKKDWKTCISWARKGEALFPQEWKALYNHALCELELKNYSSAEDLFLKTLELNSRLGLAQNGLGVVAMQRGDLPKACGHFKTALELSPNLPVARQNLQLCLTSIQK